MTLICAGWLACCVLSYGVLYAYFRALDSNAQDSEQADHVGSFWLSIWGPLSLFFATFFTEGARHGLRFKRH